MNLLKLLSEFNPSKFIVYNCLLVFTMLFALKLDLTISANWFLIFAPLFFWKLLALIGSTIAIYIWFVNPSNPNSTYRLNDSSYIHFKSMLISLMNQLLLLMFELLCCDKLQNNRNQFLWVINFLPLIFISLLSIANFFWAMKNDRSFELELFCSVNIIQFIFIALRLDNLIKFSWFFVLVPLFVIVSLSLIGCIYALFFLILIKSPDSINIEQRKSSLNTAIAYTFVILPFLIFLFLLANKLDSVNQSHNNLHFNFITTTSFNNLNIDQMNYFTVFMPLYFSLITLILLSFFNTGNNNNSWYFGIQKDFGTILLKACPCIESMREYANISYNKQNNSTINQSNNNLENVDVIKNQQLKITKPKINNVPIVPQLLIDTPD